MTVPAVRDGMMTLSPSLICWPLCGPANIGKGTSGVTVMAPSTHVENSIMAAINEKQPDQGRIVASLASECHLPIGEIATLYEYERAKLARVAHITKYLHIFAIRNVLESLRSRDVKEQEVAAREPAPFAV